MFRGYFCMYNPNVPSSNMGIAPVSNAPSQPLGPPPPTMGMAPMAPPPMMGGMPPVIGGGGPIIGVGPNGCEGALETGAMPMLLDGTFGLYIQK